MLAKKLKVETQDLVKQKQQEVIDKEKIIKQELD